MGQLEGCIICGKKTKLMFICPHCGLTYCSEHRKPGKHDCEDDKKVGSDSENLSIPTGDTLDQTSNYEDEINLDEGSSDLIEVPSFLYDKQASNLIQNKNEHISIKKSENIIDKKLTSDNIEKSDNSKRMLYYKIGVISILLLLTISYLVMNGYLFSLLEVFNKSQSNDHQILLEKYSLLEERYNDLYSDYITLEREYNTIKHSYDELEEVFEESKDYTGEITLEQMKQITIPPGSNAVFFYEIPAPGYITVEFYSDREIYFLFFEKIQERNQDIFFHFLDSHSRQNKKEYELKLFFHLPSLLTLSCLFALLNPSLYSLVIVNVSWNHWLFSITGLIFMLGAVSLSTTAPAVETPTLKLVDMYAKAEGENFKIHDGNHQSTSSESFTSMSP